MEEKFIKKVFGITLLVYFASICLVYLVSSKSVSLPGNSE